ncbi:MAG: prepilin-type N-terminal cleavage/methylation domain-containing protein [Burkholderiales bacterium]|jgi:general secretion pathway protein J|nr:prepilin-type N-terminal cleavage/methylation domain-containing protein [Burkholderiales bacterium]
MNTPAKKRGAGIKATRGFTLLEVLVALTLLVVLSGTLLGVFGLADKSREAGETRADDASSMRVTQDFLRAHLENAHPLRLREEKEFPLIFSGDEKEMMYVSALPMRVIAGGLWAWRLRLLGSGQLVLEHTIPEINEKKMPDFKNAKYSILADRVHSLDIEYFGLPERATLEDDPKWQKKWDNPQRMPDWVRIDVTLDNGTAWPVLFVELRKSEQAGCRQWNEHVGRCGGI